MALEAQHQQLQQRSTAIEQAAQAAQTQSAAEREQVEEDARAARKRFEQVTSQLFLPG